MGRHELNKDVIGNQLKHSKTVEYDGAKASFVMFDRIGQTMSVRPEAYVLADTSVLPGDLARTILCIDSTVGSLIMKAEIDIDSPLELDDADRAVSDVLMQIAPEQLLALGLERMLNLQNRGTVDINHPIYYTDSSAKIALYVTKSDSDKITIHLSTQADKDNVSVEPPLVEHINCAQAINEFATLWLIVLREIEKATSRDGEHSKLSFSLIPQKISQEEGPELFTPEIEEQNEITFSDIGGNRRAKEELLELAHSINNPEILRKWGVKRPNGILLYGPAGTGKTTMVEAFANEIGSSVWRIDSSELISKWLGQSQKNLRHLFEQATKLTEPTVMFFDEFDSIIQDPEDAMSGGDRERQATAGLFKQELESLYKNSPHIIVIAATNHPDRISDSVKRSGRFDKKIYVPIPDEEDRTEIFAIKIANTINALKTLFFTPFSDDINTRELSLATEGYTGADITALFEGILHKKAVTESRTGIGTPITQQEIISAIYQMRQQ